MRKINMRICLAMFLVLACAVAEGQNKSFGYRRKIEVAKEGWHFISFPSDLFKRLNPEFSDVRIYRITDSDTLEVPYLLEMENDKITEETIELPALNKSKKDGKLYLTFELKKGQKANYLDLDFEENNFNGYVTIEGSDDQRTWFELEKKQRILSIHNNNVDFKSTTLSFPTTNYRYLRVNVAADRVLTFVHASFRDRKLESGTFANLDFSWNVQEDKSSKSTVVTLDLKDVQPLGRFSIDAEAGGSDFYRNFSFESLRDSAKTDKGWIYYYDRLYDGYITSLDFNEITLGQPTEAKKFKLTINNYDSPPLKIKNLRAWGAEVRLIAKLSTANNYLYYSNSAAGAPSYDLVHFKDKIATDSTSLLLGEEEKLVADPVKVSPLFENKLWLWGVMGLIIGVLGFFTVRMMKNK